MKVFAGREFQVYEVSGREVRIHWNIEQFTREGMDGPEVQWMADEAVCLVSDSRDQMIEKIIASQYTVGAEIATINNKDSKPEEYAAYQAFRQIAKNLASGWPA